MFSPYQPKKVKGLRKKKRQELIEELRLMHPVWLDNKTDREIIDIINAFKKSSYKNNYEQLPSFIISYEASKEIDNKIKEENKDD